MAKFPKFVLGFLLISVLATIIFNKEQVGALANLSRWAFLLTFAGVGLRTISATCASRASGHSRSERSAKW